MIELLSINNALIVVPEGATFAVTEVIAVGAPVAVAPPLPPTNMPKLEFEELLDEVIALAFPEVTLPSKIQFLIVSLSALVTAAEVAMRKAEFAITVLVVVLLIVRFRFVPEVFGLSPSMVTLSAPLS